MHNEQHIRKAVSDNLTMTGVFRDLGWKTNGTSYRKLNQIIRKLDLDTSHWVGQGHNKGKKHLGKPFEKKPFEEVFCENSAYSCNSTLKRRVQKEGLLENKCQICGLGTSWNGDNLVLVLDHINGIHNDNRTTNLRFLCPNCNSQQKTFCRSKSSLKMHS
jgi:hypothetical protein